MTADLWDRTGVPVPVELPTVEDTEALGRRLAGMLQAGDLLVLTGPLGAGKTALVRGLGAGLGVSGRVTSPTFVLARQHRGPLPLLHVDAYRLRDAAATSGRPVTLDDLDLEEALTDGVAAVEWGEGLVEGLVDAWLEVRLERADDDLRTARVRPVGARWGV
ncbi:MAG: tRNA ((37)-N6)-threonylcarbamoyltransferase complex ATPase subunit type 1 TsaE [Frankiales bacterium]|nr:tRNA ((37)-N6)-threonylcarbamoyltransferase complex ATPase subunit type 1 TsaE [Frankiales bacterium]